MFITAAECLSPAVDGVFVAGLVVIVVVVTLLSPPLLRIIQ